ncbi:hypothetical protein GVI59_16450 [Acetobacter sicerae]|nr:hypothetical protein [Acetobacter sicerae]
MRYFVKRDPGIVKRLRKMAGFCGFVWAMVSAAGFEPTAPGFIPLRLSPPSPKKGDVRGLDCPFTLNPCGSLGAARPVSTPSRKASGLARDRHDLKKPSVPRI